MAIKFIQEGETLVTEEYFEFMDDPHCIAEIENDGTFVILGSDLEELHRSTAMVSTSIAESKIIALIEDDQEEYEHPQIATPIKTISIKKAEKPVKAPKRSAINQRWNNTRRWYAMVAVFILLLIFVLCSLWGMFGLFISGLYLVGVFSAKIDKLLSRFGLIGGSIATLIASLVSMFI